MNLPDVKAPVRLQDRALVSTAFFRTDETGNAQPLLQPVNLKGNGALTCDGPVATMAYEGDSGSYQLRLVLPKPALASGVGAFIRLRDWEKINYIAIGYTGSDGFEHVKAANPGQDMWFEFSVGHGDLAWGWRNNWESPEDREIADIRLYIKGEPGEISYLDVEEMFLWQEDGAGIEAQLGDEALPPAPVLDAIRAYEKKCFRNYETQARAFMQTGQCPLYGDVMLDWPSTEAFPPKLLTNNTYQFSWHALHSAVMLMLFAQDSGEAGPVFAARDFTSNWINRSYLQPDPNLKYAWYDHGTAERCLAMVQLYAMGQKQGFDRRFQSQLRQIIFRHAQLLASEVFYAGHQPTRYHNHAWFQDMVLLAVSLAFPSWPVSRTWGDLAIARLEDQFSKLIVRDGGFSVFVENSIGYHHRILRIVEFAGALATLSGRDTPISAIAADLQHFADFFRYPGVQRIVSQGDTFRLPNPEGKPGNQRQAPYSEPEASILPNAGYAIIKANHGKHPFMLTMLATSLSRTHKHEDNLSISLFFDGLEWLIDPSFHSHEYAAPIPSYLQSAAAHNAVSIPGRAYSIDPGHARLAAEKRAEYCSLTGEHTAYAGLTVTRDLRCDMQALDLEVADTLSEPCAGAQLRFHCGEHVSVDIRDDKATLSHPGSAFQLTLTVPGLRPRVASGVTDGPEMAGIVGHGFLQSAAINTVIVDLNERTEVRWRLEVA